MSLTDIESKILSIISSILDELDKKQLKLFENKPTVQYCFRGNYIGLSIKDDNNTKIRIELKNEPDQGKKYIFINKKIIENEYFNSKLFAKSEVIKYLEEIREEDAYSVNVERVNNLISKGEYAVAIVFLVTAFENAVRDIFFRNNDLWSFEPDSKLIDDKFIELGTVYDERFGYSLIKEINGTNYGLSLEGFENYNKWKKILIWEEVFKFCRKLLIYNEYYQRLLINQSEEIGSFEILKDALRSASKRSQIINFQRIREKGSFTWLFKNTFSISFQPIQSELNIMENAISTRHKIIHRFLKDEQVNEDFVKDALNSMKKIISYIKATLQDKRDESYFIDEPNSFLLI